MFYVNNAADKRSMDDVWYLDSGCSNHMTGREDVLTDIDRSITAKVAMGIGQLVNVIGKGSLMVETKMRKRYIKEVLLVSGLKENLLSVGQMIEHEYFLFFGDNKAEIYDDCSLSNLVTRVQMKGNKSFPLKLQTDLHFALKASISQSTLIWHRRMGHLNFQSLKLLQNEDMVLGLPKIKNTSEVGEGCTFGKHCKKSFPKEATSRATTPLELIYFLRYKSEVFNVFKKFKATVELQSAYKLKKLRSDKGGEYTSNEFNRFCDEIRMERQLTVAYSPQQNGVAERKNRTIVEMAKSMMFEKSIPLEFWAKAVNTVVYILNICPTKALVKKTPFEAYSGRKPGIKHLRVFGSLCYAHVPNQQRQKLDLASKRCVFLGYASCEKGYRLYNLVTGKVIISRDVVFNEDASWDWNAQQECSVSVPLTEMVSEKEEEINDTTVMQAESSVANDVLLEDSEEEFAGIHTGAQDIDHTPLKYKSLTEIYERCSICIIEPETFEEAIKDASWKKAMETELEMIKKNDTWELLKGPSEKPVVGVKWIYKVKLNLDGSIQKNKARLVAKGHTQKPGIDFNETFAPVARLDIEDRVYRLKKALYGLKQAPRAWYEEINSYFTVVGFQRSPSEATLYVKTVENCKEVATPHAMNEKLSKEDGSEQADERVYRQIVGSLLYLIATRPDIMFADLQGSIWGLPREYLDTFKSSKECVALSTAEAEYISVAEAVLLRFVLSDFGEEQVEATQIFCDNTSAIAITKNPVHHHKTRHINRRFHYIQDALQNVEIDLLYCRTGEQNADIFTKVLAKDRFENLRSKLGVISAKHLEGSVKV
ncbi:unnamed protein product [Prunus armeniaca]